MSAAIGGELKTSIGLPKVAQLLPLAASIDNPDQIRQIVLLPPYTHGGGPEGSINADWNRILPLVHQFFHDREIRSRRRSRRRDVRLRHDLIPVPREQAVEGHNAGAEAHGSDTACSGPDAAGTLYMAQSGAIYSLSSGRFHQLTPEADGASRRDTGWQQSHRGQERRLFLRCLHAEPLRHRDAPADEQSGKDRYE